MKNLEPIELENELEDGVRQGHVEKNDAGEYRLTDSGKNVVAIHLLLDVFDVRHDSAYSFGALVTATALAPENIVNGLSKLISDGLIQFGIVSTKNEVHIFHLCKHQKKLRVYLGKDETPGDRRYDKYVHQILEKVGPSGRPQ